MSENMTYWDLSRKLADLSKMIEAIPASVIRACDESSADSMMHVEGSIRAAMKKLSDFQDQFGMIDMEVWKRSEESWKRIEEARAVFDYRLRRLEWPKVEIPCGIKPLVDLAERFRHLDDATWARVVELAKVLGGRA